MTIVTVLDQWGKKVFEGFLVANRPSPWEGWNRVYFPETRNAVWRERLRNDLNHVHLYYGWNFIMNAADNYVDLAPAWRIKKEEPVNNIEDAQARIKRAQEELEAAQRDLEEANKPRTKRREFEDTIRALKKGTVFRTGQGTIQTVPFMIVGYAGEYKVVSAFNNTWDSVDAFLKDEEGIGRDMVVVVYDNSKGN